MPSLTEGVIQQGALILSAIFSKQLDTHTYTAYTYSRCR